MRHALQAIALQIIALIRDKKQVLRLISLKGETTNLTNIAQMSQGCRVKIFLFKGNPAIALSHLAKKTTRKFYITTRNERPGRYQSSIRLPKRKLQRKIFHFYSYKSIQLRVF